jgi:hypothetical protein
LAKGSELPDDGALGLRRNEIAQRCERAVKHLQTALFHSGQAVLTGKFLHVPDFAKARLVNFGWIYAHIENAYALRVLLYSWAQHGAIYVRFVTDATNGSHAQTPHLPDSEKDSAR